MSSFGGGFWSFGGPMGEAHGEVIGHGRFYRGHG